MKFAIAVLFVAPVLYLIAKITVWAPLPDQGWIAYKAYIQYQIRLTLIIGATSSFLGSAIAVADSLNKWTRFKAWGALLRFWGSVAAFYALVLSSMIFFETGG